MPAHTNPSGDIFGGWLMSQADIAGAVIAYQIARGRVATRAVTNFEFLEPVLVGDLVSCYAELERVGRTSIQVRVQVSVERARDPRNVVDVARALITYVALDADRHPRKVPPVG